MSEISFAGFVAAVGVGVGLRPGSDASEIEEIEGVGNKNISWMGKGSDGGVGLTKTECIAGRSVGVLEDLRTRGSGLRGLVAT